MANSGTTTRSPGGGFPDEVPSCGVPDGALLRFSLSAGPLGPWAESIPPVPVGATATVTFSSDSAEAEHSDALRLLGYAVLGIHPFAVADGRPSRPRTERPETAEMVVARADLDRHRTWFTSLLSQSTAAYDLSLGPVQMALGERLRPHLAHLRSVTG